MTLAHPLWLLAGVCAAATFLAFAHLASKRARAGALAYSDLAFFEAATRRRFDPALPLALAIALGLAALGGALAHASFVAAVPVRGGAVVLCVDTSGSMRATDVFPSRSAAAANAVRAFVDGVPEGTRVGIVSFSSGAGVVAPLSSDKPAIGDAIATIP
ncbi:MAG: VWA domain-containing protein, partial [Candidatus Eremiobacteraeota bacterium]|nr:VWA domain-containing protein [Candidatus Eremiobacteraeota bacterium]